MRTVGTRRAGFLLSIAISLVACGARTPSSPAQPSLLTALPAMQIAVATSTGYPAEAIVLMAGPARLRLSISDARLVASDQAARERAATELVAALERAMESRPDFTAIQEIDIAIVHPAEAGGAMSDAHVEDILQFRRAPNQRFVHHIS